MPYRRFTSTYGRGNSVARIALRRAARVANMRARGYRYRGRRTAARRLIVPGYTRTGGAYAARFKAGPSGLLPERKWLDYEVDGYADTTPEFYMLLSAIPQGDSGVTRDGQRCTIQSLELHFSMVYATNTSLTAPTVSIWLVQDTQANGALPAFSDVLVTGTDPSTSFVNLNNRDRFRIIKKWVKNFNVTAGTGGTNSFAITKNWKYFKILNLPMVYSGTTGTISEHKTNSLMIFAASDRGDDTVNLNINSRIRFVG